MTTYSKRRGRRSLAAIAAAMLMASVLAVVAGSPAQAANTSSEALVDTNSDGKGDSREFGGRDRSDTANRLAENFGKAEGLGNAPVAFVASGHMLVDAISVAGLVGFLDAPVLLTPNDSLNGGVGDFIEDYGVQTVHVLGGPAAVADSVVEAIEGLANEPTVTRIFGDDRYATAAAVASRLGGPAAWCGGTDAAAILANGGDVSLAYAMAVGPIASRLQLPVLLTAHGELPAATRPRLRRWSWRSWPPTAAAATSAGSSAPTDSAGAAGGTTSTKYRPAGNSETVGTFETQVTYERFATGPSTHNLRGARRPVSEVRVVPSSFDCERFSSEDMAAVCNAVQDGELLPELSFGTAAWWAPQDVTHEGTSFRLTYHGWVSADQVLRLTVSRL